jgi:probable phosphoglycerate mutase
MRLFVFARHGESTLNVARLVNGDPYRPVHLTRRGRLQACRLGEQLRNTDLDVAFCTRFPRTRQTAEIALAGRRVPLLIEPGFDDVDVGELDCATVDDFRDWKRHHRRGEPFPGGESLDEASERYAEGLRMLVDRSEQRVLVVCHAVAIRSILEALDEAGWRRIPNAIPYLFDENAIGAAAHRLALYGQMRNAS